MNRIVRLFVLIAWSAAALAACAKPKAEDCEKAVANIRAIYGTAGIDFGVSPEAAVRSCRGGTRRASVQCMINAKTMEDLRACEGGVLLGDEEETQAPAGQDTEHPPEQPAQ
jgi:hypothetical protein